MRILIVDDETWMRLALRAMLEQWGYEVVEASDGEDAWQLLLEQPIGMVLCDWVMPRLDGLAFCRRLRAADLAHYVYVILLTGKDQTEDLCAAFDAGADDFHSKPLNPDELNVRIRAGERVLRLEQALRAKNGELEEANRALQLSQERIRRDLQAAVAVQQSLLPESAQTGLPLDLAWAMVPAEELGGDLFSFYPLDERHLGFYLIDVSGHGVPAAMFSVHLARLLSSDPRSDSLVRRPCATPESATTRLGVVRAFGRGRLERATASESARTFSEPETVVSRLNGSFQADDRNMIYFTMIYGVIDATSGRGSLCQAGHPYPLICRRDGRVEPVGGGGLPVGLVPDAHYESVGFELRPGDRLLLYSDGVTECFNPERVPFGTDRLAEVLRETRGESLRECIARIEAALIHWQSPREATRATFSDDLSLLVIELCAS